MFDNKLHEILDDFQSGEIHRKNSATRYIGRTPSVFNAMMKKGEMPAPKCVQIEITNSCSTGCRMCYRYTWATDKNYTPERELATKRWFALFEELASEGVKTIIWSGGEPTTHPDFEDLLKASKQVGLRSGILSNGVDIDVSKADTIVKHADWIRISLDDLPGISSKTIRTVLKDYQEHVPLNISLAVKQSLDNIKIAQEKYGEALEVGLAYTIQKDNVYGVPKMAQYASEIGIVTTFKIAHGWDKKFLCSEEELTWLQNEVLSDPSLISNPYVNFQYLHDFFFQRLNLVDITSGVPTRQYYEKNQTICFTPFLFSLIDSFGGVYVCCHLYDDNGFYTSEQREKYCVGQITDNKFMNVWRSATYHRMRQELQPIDIDKTPCGNCTRHWVPNSIVTRLYQEIFLPMVIEFGFEGAMTQYKNIINRYPEEEGVWF